MTTNTTPEGAQDEAPALQIADMLLRRQAQRVDALEATAAAAIQQMHYMVDELKRELAAIRARGAQGESKCVTCGSTGASVPGTCKLDRVG